MASRIAGITVEIGGDTTKLSKALEGVNKSIKTTQAGLKDVNKLLKLAPSNTEAVTQKQKMLKEAIEARIREKTSESLVGNMVSEGTTHRRLTDLLGSLCDLTSGSGDKGTPIVYIQGYFDNYSND